MSNQKFKKGDWVVTPYNKFPFQLDEDGAFGIFDSLSGGERFFTVSAQDADVMDKPLVYAVKDTRNGIISSEGWVRSTKVRMATKKDLKLMVDWAKERVKIANAELKFYVKERNSL